MLYEYKLKNGVVVLFDVDEINYLTAYNNENNEYGNLNIHMKDGKVHEISGRYSDHLTKDVLEVAQEIKEMTCNQNNKQQYD